MEKSYPAEHIVLRETTLEDCPRIEEIINDRDIAKTTTNIPFPYPKGGAQSFLEYTNQNRADGVGLNFSIALKETNEVIGAISFGIFPDSKKAELGYWLGKAYWGKGYMTEAAKKMIEIGFSLFMCGNLPSKRVKEYDWNRIYATAYTNNPASSRVMEKAGMKYEATHRKEIIKWGEPIDLAYYSILREEFEDLEKVKQS